MADDPSTHLTDPPDAETPTPSSAQDEYAPSGVVPRHVRRELARLYLQNETATRVSADAGLDVREIVLTGSADDVWHSICTVATAAGRVEPLIAIALEEHPQNSILLAYQREIRHRPRWNPRVAWRANSHKARRLLVVTTAMVMGLGVWLALRGDLLDGWRWKRQCEAGVASSCVNRGVYEWRHGRERDGLQFFHYGCVGGAPLGCAYMGSAYAEGRGVARNESRARLLFATACDRGEQYACAALGNLLAWGRGGVADPARGISLMQNACRAGEPQGCSLLDAYCRDHYRDGCGGV